MARPLPHMIAIDDARLFGTDPAYPTVAWVQQYVARYRHRYRFELEDDIIRIVPVGMP